MSEKLWTLKTGRLIEGRLTQVRVHLIRWRGVIEITVKHLCGVYCTLNTFIAFSNPKACENLQSFEFKRAEL